MTLTTQFMTILAMIGMGGLFGAALDTYNRFLQRSKRKQWIVFVNDILFWLLQGLLIFYILFLVNQGELRFYIFVALLCGFAAYQSLLKQVYLRLLEMMISIVVSTCVFFIKTVHILLIRPLQALMGLIISVIFLLGRGIFALVKFVFAILLFITKVLLKPFKWIAFVFWKLLPNHIKKTVEKLYNRMAGILLPVKNYVMNWVQKWKKNRK